MTKLKLNDCQAVVVTTAIGNGNTALGSVANNHVGETTINFSNGTSITIRSIGLLTGAVLEIARDMSYTVKLNDDPQNKAVGTPGRSPMHVPVQSNKPR